MRYSGIRLRVFGPPRIEGVARAGAEEFLATRSKAMALLAWLAVEPPAFQRRDAAAALLWPELSHDRARAAVRQAVWTLRRALGAETIVARGDSEIGVGPDRVTCDAVDFRKAVEESKWERALDLYHGDFLAGFHIGGAPEFEHWVARCREALAEHVRTAARALAEHAERAGDFDAALRWIRREADLDPFDEAVARRLIGGLDRVGQRAEALRVYEALAARLRDELGVGPDPETHALAHAIQSRAGPATPPAPRSRANPRRDFVRVQPAREPETEARPRRLRARGALAIAGLAALVVGYVSLDPTPTVSEAADPPSSAEVRTLFADANHHLDRWFQVHETAQSIDLLKQAVELDPSFAAGWADLSVAHMLRFFRTGELENDRAAGEAALARAMSLAPDAYATIVARAFYHYCAERDYDRAWRQFETARQIHPDDPQVLEFLGWIERRRGHWDAGAELFAAAADADPTAWGPLFALANSYLAMRRFDEAREVYARARAVAPELPATYHEMFWVEIMDQGDLDAAEKVALEAPIYGERQPTGPNLGILDYFRRDYDAALRRWKTVDGFDLYALGVMYRRMNHPRLPAFADSLETETRRHLEEHLDHGESNPGAHAAVLTRLANALALGGKSDEAVAAVERAVEIHSVARDASGGRYRLWSLAAIYTLVGDVEAAIATLERLLEIPSPATPTMLRIDPLWDALRDDPRFQRLIEPQLASLP